jgi:hypothetical protein
MKDETDLNHVSGVLDASSRRIVAALSLLATVACGSHDDGAEPLATIELEDGNIVSFERLGDGISVTEAGLAVNGSHLAGAAGSPIDLFHQLAPGRELPEALAAERERSTFLSDLPAGTLVFPSREAYERFDMSTLGRYELDPDGPTWMGERTAPARPQAPSVSRAAPSQTGGFQQGAGACGSFIATQCNLQSAGLLGSIPDDLAVLPNIQLRIDDNDAARGVHLMCAADGDATLRVFVPELPTQGTGGDTRFIAEGSFIATQWQMPAECIDAGDRRICFFQDTFVSVDARTEVFDVGSFHYCRAYDSNPA